MNKLHKNLLTAFIIISITALTLYLLPLIPNYLRPIEPDDILWNQIPLVITFIIINIILIGIPAGIHWLYVKDYTPIKNIWFFAIFGGIIGALLGEIVVHGASLFMIIPYTILLLIYALFYRKFTWWKVILTTYLGGILVENIMNRSPIQVPTLLWVAFFTYPYFITKIWENRNEIRLIQILKDFKWALVFSVLLVILSVYISKRISPPLILLGATLPFIIGIIYKIFKKKL